MDDGLCAVPLHDVTGKFRVSRLVLGFYGSVEHAEEALHEIRKNRFRRSAVVHCADDGDLNFLYAGTFSLQPGGTRYRFALPWFSWAEVSGRTMGAGPSGIVGFLVTWFGIALAGVGASRRKLLRHYGRFLLPGESLVVVQATGSRHSGCHRSSEAYLTSVCIRNSSRVAIGFFQQPDETLRDPVTLADLAGLRDRTGRFSPTGCIHADRGRCCRSFESAKSAIERARADLAEAARLDYGITHAAEWLLDNAYLIRSNIADIRHNLPDNHNKILPVIADTSSPVRFRIYHLAADLIDRTGHRVTAESIVSFLNAYQHQAPLTIAELWVFPLMLRLVLLERLQRSVGVASLRQHQKEMADFWADRVLNAAHRSPEQFEKMSRTRSRRRRTDAAFYCASRRATAPGRIRAGADSEMDRGENGISPCRHHPARARRRSK